MIESQTYSQSEISYDVIETSEEIETTRKFFRILISIAFTFLTLMILYSLPSVQRRIIYPMPYRESIETYSTRFKVDRNLAAAVIKNESNFNIHAKSYVGAIGLMQLMPETAAWISTELGENFSERSLYSPETNIRYGVWYLRTLRDEFHGNDILAIAAYNAGSGNVRYWMEENHWGENFSDVNAIPYPETRAFVKKVLLCKEKYRKLY